VKKKFDVLAWIRKVRDEYHHQERGLAGEEKLRRTREAADRFRDSRRQGRTSQTARE